MRTQEVLLWEDAASAAVTLQPPLVQLTLPRRGWKRWEGCSPLPNGKAQALRLWQSLASWSISCVCGVGCALRQAES